MNKQMTINTIKREPGHMLLKRLGKTKLRPGGVRVTDWLIDKIDFSKSPRILEVACNEAENIMNFAKKYHNKNVGIDLNEQAIASAKQSIDDRNLSEYVDVMVADATNLPFEDESFDVVINEAMLTMLSETQKQKAIKEYYRVLKKGGILLTHDVMLVQYDKELVSELQYVIHNPAVPHIESDWIKMFKNAGFTDVKNITGKMTLLSSSGMMIDEGLVRMIKIILNGITDKNRGQFLEMMKFFRHNKAKFGFIGAVSVK